MHSNENGFLPVRSQRLGEARREGIRQVANPSKPSQILESAHPVAQASRRGDRVGMNLGGSRMSLTLHPWGLSNPGLKPWVITVVVVVVISWSAAADVVSAYADVFALTTVLLAGSVPQQSTQPR
ncbi:hypothetical protein [Streptomyces sp. NPDC059402]|uniref:hypothetical protein n=1 Tax=unclassified Streptomyces TaxID=2593676 RepID=UPI0036BBB4CC